MLPVLEDLKPWLSLHFVLNTIACTLYIVLKIWPSSCNMFFEVNENGECGFDYRDIEILMFLCFVIVLKNRRWKPLTAVEYISNVYLFAKCGNTLLFFRQDLRWGVLYSILCLILFVAVPEPIYKGPEKIIHFRRQALDERLFHHPKETWIVEFYAPWSPPCTRFASTFAKLSLHYDNDLLKFGKLDVNKYEKIAQKYRIDVSVKSKNLPTIVVFEKGKEILRRPTIDAKGIVTSYQFKEENLIQDLNLNELFKNSKEKAKSIKKKDD